MPANPNALSITLLAQFGNKGLPRGIRNNNPGNIEYNKANDWQGQFRPEDIPLNSRDPRFAQFQDPTYGIRAMIVIFRNYQKNYGLKSVKELIKRWAPPSENNTVAYATNVANAVGVPVSSEIDLKDQLTAERFIKAVIAHETGVKQPYSDSQVCAGIRMATNV
ncbi:endolysin [Burkholderia phage BcepGomr]|uniref:endolysin n=1 Tax=Burkholderia phage BcepGomr TaxID=437329 RepID=UPI0001503553|nr:endolysin [Burkholderia phage BcepGomr]ABP63642.1 BcepGomrgp71 [Burkholderia phage BcepGomr]